MSTFLQLCQEVRQEAGLSGTGPSSVQSQVGMDKKVVDWVNDAWYDIQSARPNWRWMWNGDGLITTTAGEFQYDPASFGFVIENIVPESVSITKVGVPSSLTALALVEYDVYRDMTAFTQRNQAFPTVATIAPNNKLILSPTPDDAYEIAFEYYSPPTYLVDNSDIPGLPAKFMKIIVELALVKYAAHDDAVGVMQSAQANYMKWMRRLEAGQLLDVSTSSALA
jgi:hypothetical protein